jgi:FkbM family methyltransferase
MFTPFNRLKKCRHGTMLFNFNDIYIGRSLDLYGEWTEGEVELFQQLIYPGNHVVEAGSNIGAHTLFLANAVGPTGSVLAIEPQRLVFQTLCANLALNDIPNVDARQLALGSRPGTTMVPALDYTQSNNFGGVALGRYAEGETVQVIPLDSFNLPSCDFLKIDVEGMETEVLEGAAATIARCQPVIYVENDRQDKSTRLIRTLDAFGYKMYWHLPYLYQPMNFAGNSENVFDGIASANMVCVHQSNLNYNFEPFKRVPVPPA